MFNLKEKVKRDGKIIGYILTKDGKDMNITVPKMIELLDKEVVNGISDKMDVYRDINALYRIEDKKDDIAILLNLTTKKKNKVPVSQIIDSVVSKKIYLENGFVRRTKLGNLSLVQRELKENSLVNNASTPSSTNNIAKEVQEHSGDLENIRFLTHKYIVLPDRMDLFYTSYYSKKIKFTSRIILYIEKTDGYRLLCRLCKDKNKYLKYGDLSLIYTSDSVWDDKPASVSWGLHTDLKEIQSEIDYIFKQGGSEFSEITKKNILSTFNGLDIQKFSNVYVPLGDKKYLINILLDNPVYLLESKIDGFYVINE